MSVTFGGRQCLDPVALRERYNELDDVGRLSWLPPDQWARANDYRCPVGWLSGEGQLLLQRRDLDAIDLNGFHDLAIDGPDGDVTLRNLRVAAAKAITPGVEDDPETAYLVTVCDRRKLLKWADARLSRSYNVQLDRVLTRRVVEETTVTTPLSGSTTTTTTSDDSTYSQTTTTGDDGTVTITTITTRSVTDADGDTTTTQTIVVDITYPDCSTRLTTTTTITYPDGSVATSSVSVYTVTTETIADDGTRTVTTTVTTTTISVEGLTTVVTQTTTATYSPPENGVVPPSEDDGAVYHEDSLNPDTNDLWTWDEMLGSMWTAVGSGFLLGAFPGLGFTPDFFPVNIGFRQASALWALRWMLSRFRAELRLDPVGDAFGICYPGAPNAARDVAERKWSDVKVWDSYPIEPIWIHVPEKFRLLVPKVDLCYSSFGDGSVQPTLIERQQDWTLDPWYLLETTDPTGYAAAGAYPGGGVTQIVTNSGLYVLRDNQTVVPSSLTAWQSTLSDWARWFFTTAHRKRKRLHRAYSGMLLGRDPAMIPGNLVTVQGYGDRWAGGIMEAMLGPPARGPMGGRSCLEDMPVIQAGAYSPTAPGWSDGCGMDGWAWSQWGGGWGWGWGGGPPGFGFGYGWYPGWGGEYWGPPATYYGDTE